MLKSNKENDNKKKIVELVKHNKNTMKILSKSQTCTKTSGALVNIANISIFISK